MNGRCAGALAGPREAFDRFREMTLREEFAGLESLLADDGVVEIPFAPPGAPRRIEGRQAFAAWVAPHRAAVADRIRFTAVRDVAVHESSDPEVAVVEYVMEGERLTDGRRAAAPFAVVVRVRDGRIALWREYQDPVAMAAIVAD